MTVMTERRHRDGSDPDLHLYEGFLDRDPEEAVSAFLSASPDQFTLPKVVGVDWVDNPKDGKWHFEGFDATYALFVCFMLVDEENTYQLRRPVPHWEIDVWDVDSLNNWLVAELDKQNSPAV